MTRATNARLCSVRSRIAVSSRCLRHVAQVAARDSRSRTPGTGSPPSAARPSRAQTAFVRSTRQRPSGSGTSAIPWRPSRVGIAQSNVSMPSSTPAIRSSISPIPSRWRGPVLGQHRRRPADDLVHLRLVGAERAADRDPVAGARGDRSARSRRAGPRGRRPARSRRRAGPRGRARACQSRQRSSQRCVRSVERAVYSRLDVERRALVEDERDVRAEVGLDLHRGLRAHEALGAVDVGAEAHALLLDARGSGRCARRRARRVP